MALVVMNSLLRDFLGDLAAQRQKAQIAPALHGPAHLHIEADTVREVIKLLDQRYPGLGEKLAQGVAVAIDGEIYADAMLQPVHTESEVVFIPPIEGG